MGEKAGTNSKSMLHSILQLVMMFAICPPFQIPIYPALPQNKAYQKRATYSTICKKKRPIILIIFRAFLSVLK